VILELEFAKPMTSPFQIGKISARGAATAAPGPSPTQNRLIAAFPPEIYARLRPHLLPVAHVCPSAS